MDDEAKQRWDVLEGYLWRLRALEGEAVRLGEMDTAAELREACRRTLDDISEMVRDAMRPK